MHWSIRISLFPRILFKVYLTPYNSKIEKKSYASDKPNDLYKYLLFLHIPPHLQSNKVIQNLVGTR